MTCREKMKKERPENIDSKFYGGCGSCPVRYYPSARKYCEEYKRCPNEPICTACWDQPVPDIEPETAPSESIESTEQKSSIPSMTDLQWLMREALGYPGIAVSITFMEDAITFNAYPHPIQDESEGENK